MRIGCDLLGHLPKCSVGSRFGFAWDSDNRLRQSSYDVLNASVEWSAPKNAWGIRLWGRNLTGTHYCACESATTLIDSCAPAPPRTYGMTLSANF
jgi:iron complex outermembrane receptor protein